MVLQVDWCTTDPSMELKHALSQKPSELLLWGPRVDCEPAGRLHPVQHELSAAARTFKAQALRSIGADARVEPAEAFWAADALDFAASSLDLRAAPSVVGGLPYG